MSKMNEGKKTSRKKINRNRLGMKFYTRALNRNHKLITQKSQNKIPVIYEQFTDY